MPVCREGHHSATDDYCDECGAPMLGAPATAVGAAAEHCPVCGAPRTGRFCEEDGYDFVLRPPVTPEPDSPADSADTPGPLLEPPTAPASVTHTWIAVVTADRAYYNGVIAQNGPDAASISFPAVYPERRIQLNGPQVLIGRHSASRGLHPQIDLTGPPEDPGVSHLHAVLQPTSDGSWTIVDPGSTNGTTINDDDHPIEVGVPIPLRQGDRIHVGAWTTIKLDVDPVN
jgi:FHA domain